MSLVQKMFRNALNSTFKNHFIIACWKKPRENIHHFIVSLHKLSYTTQSLDTIGKGFVISPFLTTGGYHFVRADVYYESHKDIIQFAPSISEAQKDDFLKWFFSKGINDNEDSLNMNLKKSFLNQNTSLKKKNFIQLVKKALESINEERFEKVVLSRYKIVSLPENFNLIDRFFHLCSTYPDAFVSLVYLPSNGVWIGATPETLVHIDKNQIFRTVALAGTQLKGLFKDPRKATWTQKEIIEQALVSRHIIDCFKQIRLREFIEKGPYTTVAGDLLHLCTEFSVDMKVVSFPRLGDVMLKLLHPTSAICGRPKDMALDFILKYEKYNRQLFSGYLGPVNVNNESHIFVNLRCIRVFRRLALAYAGAGITADSIPQEEWKEVEMKMKTITDHI